MTDEELKRALAALSGGGVVAAATETFFGLLADARRADAIERVFSMKDRAADKGVALLLPARASWSLLVAEIPKVAALLADRFWPGPLTIALPAREGLDPRVQVDGTVAVRWAGASDANRIVEAFGAPVTATSANLAGGAPCASERDVRVAFAAAIDRGALTLVPGHAPGGTPSTLVRVLDGRVRIVRRGAIAESDLAAIVPVTGFG